MTDNLFGWCNKAEVAIVHGDLAEGVQRIFGMGILPAIAADTFDVRDYGLTANCGWTMVDVQNYFDDELASWLEYSEIVGMIAILDFGIAHQYTDEYATYALLDFDGWELGYVLAVRGWLDTLRWMREEGIRQ